EGISAEDAFERTRTMERGTMQGLALQEVRDYRLREGEITGRPGRPKTPGGLQPGETRLTAPTGAKGEFLAESMEPETLRRFQQQQGVRLPGRPTPQDVGILPLGTMRKFADQRGWEVQVTPGQMGAEGKVRLIGDGGATREFDTMREATSYLLTQQKKPKMPIELKSPATGESTLE